MKSIPTRIYCCFTAILVIPTSSARVIFPLSVVAAQSAGQAVAVDQAQMHFAPALAVKRLNAYPAYPAGTVSNLEVENAGKDDDEDSMLYVNGQEDFVNMKVRRIAQLMRGKHPPYVRFG